MAIADPSPPHFVDVAPIMGLTQVHTGGSPQKEYIVEAKGGGAAFLDFDGDGDLDIYWVNGATLATCQDSSGGNILYRNDGDTFVDISADLGVEGRGWGMGALSADYDNDGDADLYITNLQENILYRNGGDTFVDATAQAGVAMPRWSSGAAFADYDLDGDLDLYVANYIQFQPDETPPLGAQWNGIDVFVGPRGLRPSPDVFYRNNGDGTFEDLTSWARLAHPSPGYGLGVLFADSDEDGYPDLYVANDSSPNFLYHNRGDGRFTDVSLPANAAYGKGGGIQAGMGLAWGDYDGDQDPDIFVTHFEGEHNELYRNGGDGRFDHASQEAGLAKQDLAYVGFGTGFFDGDNDGDLDLFVANGHVYPQIDQGGSGSSYAQPNHFFENTGKGYFELRPILAVSMADAHVSRGSCIGDYDNDGDLDIFVTNLNARPSLLRNDLNRGNWLGIRLVGDKSNSDGIGARLRLVTGGQTQIRDAIRGSSFLCSEDPRLHFGLGQSQQIDSLEVRWPGGPIQRFTQVPINRYLEIKENSSQIDALHQTNNRD